MKHFATAILLLTLALTPSAGATGAQDANSAYQAKNWQQVVTLYRAITATEPKNGQAWYRLGRGLEETGNGEDALVAYQQAIAAGNLPRRFADLRIAAVNAAAGRTDEALKTLQGMADSGFGMTEQINGEPRFASLQKNEHFQKILEQIAVNEAPCKNPKAPEYRQLDFWVGEWNVFDQGGNQVGGSSVKLIL